MDHIRRAASAVYLAMAILAPAVVTGQQSATRIAVVNGQNVVLGTREGKKVFDALKAKFETKKKELDSRQSDIARMEE